MNWDDLRFFLALARTGRLSKAGKLLGVEHVTVGRRIAALEASLGVALFYRTAAGWLLTPEGQPLVGHAEAAEQAMSGVQQHVRRKDVVGKVRVALIDVYASHWLAPKLPLLRKEHPGLQVELVTSLEQADLSRGEAELAIRHPRPRQRELSAVRIGTGAVALFATRAIAAQCSAQRDPVRAKGIPLLMYPSHMHFLQSAAWFRKLAERADVRLTTNNIHTLLAAAVAGHGAALLPRFVAAGEPSLVDLAGRDASRHEMWLVSHPEFRRDPRVAAMAAFLKKAAQGAQGIF